MGCRLPGGVDNPDAYWELLSNGRDAIQKTPETRWSLQKFYAPGPVAPGKTQSQWGGYVSDIDQFDAKLFGISPREAAAMDPQQRMLLEVAWRCVENAGHPIESLAGTAAGVYVGISSFDYAVAGLSYQDRGVIGPYSNTGGSSSIAANRISYCFDLRGPSVAVDTACSSSLVAVHMACESLQRCDTSVAFAGGVNALLLPDFYVAFSQLGVLSPDGRCKTFDARANGYVRSEGAGMVMLKRLSDAQRDGDQIHAVIRASVLNQDGRTQGMTVPSGDAQQALVRRACQIADIDPAAIQYVEAHGTGTPVGDPIEANALAAVVGQNRGGQNRGEPCLIGSVKTNIGHLEAGAGIASLIKVALSIRNAQIPPNLHFQSANPQIDFASLNLRVPTTLTPWPASDTPRLAGVNGFGYGGANAHVLVGQAPDEVAPSTAISSTKRSAISKHPALNLLPLSARDAESLAAIADRYADWLDELPSDVDDAAIADAVAHQRSHLEYRVGVVAESREQWAAQLREIAADPDKHSQHRLSKSQLDRGVLFVCSGQGPQWWAMGRGLLENNKVFRDCIERCDREFAKYVRWSLLDELSKRETESRLQSTRIAQPCIFALQVAVAETWRDWGIVPTAIVGHSVGEIAAAHLSGGLSFQDACCVAIHRGRTMDLATSRGAMIAVGLSPDEVRPWIRDCLDHVSIAAINGPTSITISGDESVIASLDEKLNVAGVFCRRLKVEYAFHSPQMMPVRDELIRSLANIQPSPTHTPLISTVTGDVFDGTGLDAEYWWQNVRQSVLFADAMRVASGLGFAVAVEIGPHPVLSFAITECYQRTGAEVRVVPSLHRDRNDLLCMTDSLASLYSIGLDLDWSRLNDKPSRKLDLPEYPFQRQRLWSESLESLSTRTVADYHPLLQDSVDSGNAQWQGRIDLRLQRYLRDHAVRGKIVLPAAAIIEMAYTAGKQIAEDAAHFDAKQMDSPAVCLESLRLHHPLLLDDENAKRMNVRFDVERNRLTFSASETDESTWQTIADVTLSDDSTLPMQILDSEMTSDWSVESISQAIARCEESVTAERCYAYCDSLGLQYGPEFRCVVGADRRDGEAVVTIKVRGSDPGYALHPAALDSCFHGMIIADAAFDHTLSDLYLPNTIQKIIVHRPVAGMLTAHVRILSKDPYRMLADIDIVDASGQHCVSIRGFESRRVSGPASVTADPNKIDSIDLIYRYVWQPSEVKSLSSDNTQRLWCVLSDRGGLGAALVGSLRQLGDVYQIQHGTSYRRLDDRTFIIDPENLDDFARVLDEMEQPPTDIVFLWGLDAPENSDLNPARLERSTVLTTLAPTHWVQAWERVHDGSAANLTLVTTDAQSPDDTIQQVAVAQSPLIGMGRVMISECSRLRCKLVDVTRSAPFADVIKPSRTIQTVDQLLAEIVACGDDEDEIMYRDGKRFVRRFVPQARQPLLPTPKNYGSYRLRRGNSAAIEELRYETEPSRILLDDQVEIAVEATGLNFSDVMKALDLYPGLPDGPVALGAECAGRISRVGQNVSQWKPGDQVIAIAPGSFADKVVVDAALVARQPQNLSAQQAAALPIAFLTAQYALHECARMRKGESVLIHSASGGVGLAAIQLALAAGVEVLATAGTAEKRQYVLDAGASYAMDSRSLAFAQQTMAITGGRGVDAILNSLPGEAIEKGLSILNTGGRFLEIGKRDIYADRPLGLAPMRNNLAMFAIDLDQLFKVQPERMGDMLRDLVPRFESNELQPLPTIAYPVAETREAYRFMQQAKHVGKVTVRFDSPPDALYPSARPPVEFRADATYWIAGGTGGFGLQIARWMAQRGARHLVLSGRRKKLPADVSKQVESMKSMGVEVKVLPADITCRADVDSVLRHIDDHMPPLKGMFHTAMVLEDRLLADLDRETLTRVLRPKVIGGWNMHEASLDRSLDHFVLFSSLSSVFGHAGQANYSAANALLDSLTHYRRAVGLPGLVINWGHLGEVGYLAQRDELGQRLERQGVLSFTVRQATDALQFAMQNEALQLSVLKMDWSLWRGLGITSDPSPRFAHLLQHRNEFVSGGVNTLATAKQIREADSEDRREMIRAIVCTKTASLLGMELSQVESHRPLVEMGLDSLMAVELRNWIESRIEISLPIAMLMRCPSIDQLATEIESLTMQSPGSYDESQKSPPVSKIPMNETLPEPITGDQAGLLLQQLPGMSESAVDQLLKQMLE
ncbi:Phthiocerol synthesis polyketide synthase type I PpsC [Stieleria varia]|uniref:Phthiocerol synthesis polyketide synthase type I PpsC n=2 Tax=Stieleria varia TaxID=2528005 RepID=A0A5C6A1L9_9BACT|nr:Phthiocerol synthesis polyketide synthase type I PpsC [Stieleria varia]